MKRLFSAAWKTLFAAVEATEEWLASSRMFVEGLASLRSLQKEELAARSTYPVRVESSGPRLMFHLFTIVD